jgi:hypothetical protein
VVIWYIFPVLVSCFKKNLATLHESRATYICTSAPTFLKTKKSFAFAYIHTYFLSRGKIRWYWPRTEHEFACTGPGPSMNAFPAIILQLAFVQKRGAIRQASPPIGKNSFKKRFCRKRMLLLKIDSAEGILASD